MRWVKFLFVFVLAMSLLGVDASDANAQGPAPSLGQGKDVKEWGDAELKILVNLAFEEKISVAQLKTIFERLNNAQRKQVSDFVAIRAGIPLNKWHQEIKSHMEHMTLSARRLEPLSINGELWRQHIEFGAYWPPPGTTYTSGYWTEKYCEGGFQILIPMMTGSFTFQ